MSRNKFHKSGIVHLLNALRAILAEIFGRKIGAEHYLVILGAVEGTISGIVEIDGYRINFGFVLLHRGLDPARIAPDHSFGREHFLCRSLKKSVTPTGTEKCLTVPQQLVAQPPIQFPL